MKKYTIGIIFNETCSKVLLILKNRPDWQKGLYNFPGGHIEKREIAEECVGREIQEECGLNILYGQWEHIGTILNKENYKVEIFTTKYNPKYNGKVKTMEDQEVSWFPIDSLPKNLITNLTWLIPFAINFWQIGVHPDSIVFGKFLYKN